MKLDPAQNTAEHGGLGPVDCFAFIFKEGRQGERSSTAMWRHVNCCKYPLTPSDFTVLVLRVHTNFNDAFPVVARVRTKEGIIRKCVIREWGSVGLPVPVQRYQPWYVRGNGMCWLMKSENESLSKVHSTERVESDESMFQWQVQP